MNCMNMISVCIFIFFLIGFFKSIVIGSKKSVTYIALLYYTTLHYTILYYKHTQRGGSIAQYKVV